MYVQRYIVAHSRNNCYQGKAAIPSLFLVVGADGAVKT
jgi:hypothetical protein